MTVFLSRRDQKNHVAIVAAVSTSTALVAVWWWLCRRRSKQLDKVLRAQVECVCGTVCLQVEEPSQQTVHMVCYCDHCQHYAQALCAHHKGNRSVVDAQGGTRTCQVYRRSVSCLRGIEYIQFSYFNPQQVPLRPQQMFRAHTTCCKTPLISAFWRELCVMGLYASNMKILNNQGTKRSSDDEEMEETGEYDGHFLHVNPDTQLWEDDSKDLMLSGRLYRINCQCALIQEKPPETTSQDQPLRPKQIPPQGYAGFPLRLLARFLWRNYVVGHTIDENLDFGMAVDHAPMRIPVQMKAHTANPAMVTSFLDMFFG